MPIIELSAKEKKEPYFFKNINELVETPGLVDLQVNGFGGVDFNTPGISVELFQKSVETIFASGVSTFLPTIITGSEKNMKSCFSGLEKCRKTIPLAKSMIAGYHLEGPFLSKKDGFSGCHPSHHICDVNYEMFLRFQESADGNIRMVTLAPELNGSISFIKKLVRDDIIVALGHTNASFETINSAVDAGASISTHLGNGTPTEINKNKNPIIFQLSEDKLFASFIADGFHLTREALKVYLRAKGSDKIILVTDATSGSSAPPGNYKFGELELSINSESIILDQETLRPLGSIVTLDQCVRNVINWYGISLLEAVKWSGINAQNLLKKSKTLTNNKKDCKKIWWKQASNGWYVKKAQCGDFIFSN